MGKRRSVIQELDAENWKNPIPYMLESINLESSSEWQGDVLKIGWCCRLVALVPTGAQEGGGWNRLCSAVTANLGVRSVAHVSSCHFLALSLSLSLSLALSLALSHSLSLSGSLSLSLSGSLSLSLSLWLSLTLSLSGSLSLSLSLSLSH